MFGITVEYVSGYVFDPRLMVQFRSFRMLCVDGWVHAMISKSEVVELYIGQGVDGSHDNWTVSCHRPCSTTTSCLSSYLRVPDTEANLDVCYALTRSIYP